MSLRHPRSNRGTIAFLILTVLLIAFSSMPAFTPQKVHAFSSISKARWIIAPGALSKVQKLDPGLASQFWNTALTNIQGSTEPPVNDVPTSWSSVADQSYTATGSCSFVGANGCRSLTADLNTSPPSISSSNIPAVLYDIENWAATPPAEIQDPCSSMQQFVKDAVGFTSIMAPALDLTSLPTSGLGGESKNWQEFLRRGLAACASSHASRYHIQAQSDELLEADYDAFVIQVALQAKAAHASIPVTAGLSTNPPAGMPTPQQLYQDSLDVSGSIDGFWLNIPTPGSSCPACSAARPDNAVQYLELADGMLPLYLYRDGSLVSPYPASTKGSSFNLGTVGSQLTWTSAQTVPAGTVIPAGTYTFQDFTDGTSGKGSARVSVSFGYCKGSGCANRTSLIGSDTWNPTVRAADVGSTSTYTTSSPTTLPSGGPYGLYTTVTVHTAGSFNLDYGSNTTETNFAIPRPSTLPAPSAQSPVLFLQSGNGLGTSAPGGQTTSTMSLATSGASHTWVGSASYPAGTIIPAGRYLFQPWTDGTRGATTAQLGLEFGYCPITDCTSNKHAIVNASTWDPTVTAGSRGDQLDPKGLSSATTPNATMLPAGGPYELYFAVTVLRPGSFKLQLNAASTPSNLATPFLQKSVSAASSAS